MNCYKGHQWPAIDKCTLACPILDHFLRGGVPCGSITELAGEASASKTQICLQLLLNCQLPRSVGGLDGSAVYIYTEGEPALSRLRELATLLPYRLNVNPATAATIVPPPSELLNNIYIERGIEDGTALLQRLINLRTILTKRRNDARPIRLIILDSIAWLFRDVQQVTIRDGDKDSTGTTTFAPGMDLISERTEFFFKISSILRRYADEFDLAVVVTNQIVDAMKSSSSAAAGHSAGLELLSSGREMMPALGLSWASCINCRIFLSKETTGPRGATRIVHSGPLSGTMERTIAAGAAVAPAALPQLRHMQIVFSPTLAQSKCAYVVEQSGVRGLHPSEICRSYAPD